MKFWEAIECLEEGKKIKRKHIEDEYFYLDEYNIIRDNLHQMYGHHRFLSSFYFDENIEWEVI